MMRSMAKKTTGGASAKRKKEGELKTQPTGKSVEAFLGAIEDEGRRKDAFELVALMKKVTRAEPKMWGTAIVGFGDYRYQYASGRGGDWFLTGFAPRKAALTIYFMKGLQAHRDMLQSLGRHRVSGSCLHIPKLQDVDTNVLSRLIAASVATLSGKPKRS